MAVLANVTFEGALPSWISSVHTGVGSTLTQNAGGLGGTSATRGTCTQAASGTAQYVLNLAGTGGPGAGLIRGIGGKFRINSFASDSTHRYFTAFANSGAITVAYLGYDSTLQRWQVYLNGLYTLYAPTWLNLGDGQVHDFFLGFAWSATVGQTYAIWYIDGYPVAGSLFDQSSINYGTGINQYSIGGGNGSAGNTSVIDWDCIYITDGTTPASSSEATSVISGYSGPVAANTSTLQLSSTLASPTWKSYDTATATVSGTGLVTLQQAAGGRVRIGDSASTVEVEFLPRTVTWTPSALSGTGPYTFTIGSVTVSDGVTTYPDLRPSVRAASGYATPTDGGSSASPYSFSVPSLVSSAWVGYIGRHKWQITSSAATEQAYATGVTVSPSTATVNGGTQQTFSAAVSGYGSYNNTVTWSAALGSVTSGGAYTAPAASGVVQTDTLTATSVQDGTIVAQATITVPIGNFGAKSSMVLGIGLGINF